MDFSFDPEMFDADISVNFLDPKVFDAGISNGLEGKDTLLEELQNINEPMEVEYVPSDSSDDQSWIPSGIEFKFKGYKLNPDKCVKCSSSQVTGWRKAYTQEEKKTVTEKQKGGILYDNCLFHANHYRRFDRMCRNVDTPVEDLEQYYCIGELYIHFIS